MPIKFLLFFVVLLTFTKQCPLPFTPILMDPEIKPDRILETATYSPIRIYFDYSGLTSLPSDKLSYLKYTLNEISTYLSSTIQVFCFFIKEFFFIV